MAGMDRKIKLLLLKLGKQGHDVSLIKEQRYSKEHSNVYSRYKLTFWRKELKRNKRTGAEKLVSVPDTYEFRSAVDLVRYMVVKSNERATEEVC